MPNQLLPIADPVSNIPACRANEDNERCFTNPNLNIIRTIPRHRPTHTNNCGESANIFMDTLALGRNEHRQFLVLFLFA